ncbi:hypothetical protein D3C87_1771100 [compost metagenome]
MENDDLRDADRARAIGDALDTSDQQLDIGFGISRDDFDVIHGLQRRGQVDPEIALGEVGDRYAILDSGRIYRAAVFGTLHL